MNGLCPKFAVFVHRFGQATYTGRTEGKFTSFRKRQRIIYHLLRYVSVVFCKMLFHEDAVLGTEIRFSNKGNIIVGAERIGDGCIIHHNVTFGMHLGKTKSFIGKPKIGNRVWIGPNTLIHGNITIGDGVTILKGSVLSKNIPPGSVVGGNPAKILQKGFDNSNLLRSSASAVTLQTLRIGAAKNV